MANETPSRPPPFMANAILNFHFDFLHTSLSMKVTLNQVIQGPLWDPDFLGGYLASWMLNIHSMNIGHLLNHSYFIKCRRRRQMEIPGVGRRRGTISSVSLLDYPHSQPPECQLCHFPDDTSVSVNFGVWIWTNLEEGALRHPSQIITGWIVWNNLHFLLWIDPILIEPFRKCCVCFNHPVQAD